jgi:penicillin-binding protein 1B
MTVNLMKGVIQHGTGRGALASGVPMTTFAGKTGTTNDYKDAWFIGFSPELLTLVWVGYDEEEKVGLTGGVAAVPIWSDFIKSARPFLTNVDFQPPENVLAFDIDAKSKALATNHCPEKITEYFIKGTEPTATCPLHH